jgi:hypothetical protein
MKECIHDLEVKIAMAWWGGEEGGGERHPKDFCNLVYSVANSGVVNSAHSIWLMLRSLLAH